MIKDLAHLMLLGYEFVNVETKNSSLQKYDIDRFIELAFGDLMRETIGHGFFTSGYGYLGINEYMSHDFLIKITDMNIDYIKKYKIIGFNTVYWKFT